MKPQDLDHLLVDDFFGELTPEDRVALESAMASEDVPARRRMLARLLGTLDGWDVPPGSPELAARIKAAARVHGGVMPSIRMTDRGPVPFRFRMREVVGIAACIAILFTLAVPGVGMIRERSRRALCAANLAGIFRGVSAYQDMYAGALPFAGHVPGSTWLPSTAGDRPFASNSRHLYRLVRHDFVKAPEVFACPSDASDRPAPSGADRQAADDFEGIRLSYASLNLGGPRPPLRPRSAIAYMSDPNPLFRGATFDSSLDPSRTNSAAHRGKGQTVLMLSGQAQWFTRPVYGRQNDNIWVIENLRQYSGTEASESEDDVQLVPGFQVKP